MKEIEQTETPTPTPVGPTQHFYFRERPPFEVAVKGFKSHPVGVIAFQVVNGTHVRVAGSQAHPSDPFERKVAVAKAMGRLKSEKASALVPIKSFEESSPRSVAKFLGLSVKPRHGRAIDWEQATHDMKAAQRVLKERTTPAPVPA